MDSMNVFKETLLENVSSFDLSELKRKHYKTYIQHLMIRNEVNEKKAFDEAQKEMELYESWMPWAIQASNEGRALDRFGELKEGYRDEQRACYYNALSYVHKYPDVDLAVGVMVFKEYKRSVENYKASKNDPILSPMTSHGLHAIHAFCIDNGKIVDPTLGTSEKGLHGSYYIYTIIPERTWRRFPFKANSRNWEGAVQVERYLQKEIKKEQRRFDFRGFLG